jgi:hypothetical protein
MPLREEVQGDMADDDQRRTANLARIRDNQRRSRARRKEYLMELEQKYRSCEQVGVEASAEIQAAARRVLQENKAILEENKRLRQLLKQKGVEDAEIDSFSMARPENPQFPSPESVALETMIGQRKPCGSCSGKSVTKSRSPLTQPDPAELTPESSTSPLCQHAQQAGLQYSKPLSASSSTLQSPVLAQPDLSTAQLYSMQTMSQPLAIDYSPIYDNNMLWQDPYGAPQTAVSASDLSSCHVAADAIRSIKPDVGQELEEELGCANGQECSVPNTQIFSIMDRYSAPSNYLG